MSNRVSSKMQGNCIICGRPVIEGHIYCSIHAEEGNAADDKILDEMSFDTASLLIEGIFRRARADYLLDADNQREDAEEFFRSDWAQKLCLGRFDVDEAIKCMDEDIENGLTRATVYPNRDEWE